MLTLSDIIENLPAHLVYGSSSHKEITISKIVAGDLMSDILVSVEGINLLVTSLATEQAIRTADIVGATAVLLVNDKLPNQQMKNLAENTDISLLCTPLPLFDACVSLNNLLVFKNSLKNA
ncbi:MAG: hypothetical protein E7062_05820 [Spirochaetaceae bacterium]|nr:hypothetical protein [Spirochaetaceae bacterium]